MKCPYAVTRVIRTHMDAEYNEQGCQTEYTEMQMNKAEFVDCAENECGAWKNGKCCYKE